MQYTEITKTDNLRPPLVGRLPIFTSIDGFNPAETGEIVSEVNEALSIHVRNLIDMEYLYWYRRGITPIWAKTKTVREEINNKINVAIPEEIVSFKNGWFLNAPAFYTSKKDNKALTNKVSKLNDFLFRSGKQEADNEMVDWFHTVGKANLFVKSNDDIEAPFKAYALDPRSSFVVRSMKPGNEPVYAVHSVVKDDVLYLDVWDRKNVYTLKGTVVGTLTTPTPNYVATAVEVMDVKPNPLKKIPIIEYYYNSVQMSAFEAAIPLIDAINALQSDRLDGVDQFIQSLLVFYNCELGEDENGDTISPQLIRAMGAVFLKSLGDQKADLKEISSQLDQTQVQVFIDNLYTQILRICGMPLTDNRRSNNHATGQAALIDNNFYQVDTVARNTEDLFIKSNRQFDEIITDILREKGLLDVKPTEIDLQFPRNETANIQSKAQAFQTLLAAGLHPELAAKKSGVSNDPVADIKMSEKYLKLIWGDPDNPMGETDMSMGEEADLNYNPSEESRQAREDARLALEAKTNPNPMRQTNGRVSNEDSDGVVGTRTYYHTRNGRREKVRAYTKKKRVEEQ